MSFQDESENRKVSVIIPSFGGDESLVRAVRSVLAQNYSDFEVILVDDNNPETEARKKTEALVREFFTDVRFKYIKHPYNRNGAAARNTGVRASSGKYITFLDDDDIYLQDKILKEAMFLDEHNEYGAVYCWRWQNNEIVQSELEGDLTKYILDLSFTPTTPALMIRRDVFYELNGFDEDFVRHQDFELILRFFKNYKIGVVREPLVKIIGNEINNNADNNKYIEVKKKFLSEFDGYICEIDRDEPGFRKYVYGIHYSVLISTLLFRGDFIKAFKVYKEDGYKGGLIFWKKIIKRICDVAVYHFFQKKRVRA